VEEFLTMYQVAVGWLPQPEVHGTNCVKNVYWSKVIFFCNEFRSVILIENAIGLDVELAGIEKPELGLCRHFWIPQVTTVYHVKVLKAMYKSPMAPLESACAARLVAAGGYVVRKVAPLWVRTLIVYVPDE